MKVSKIWSVQNGQLYLRNQEDMKKTSTSILKEKIEKYDNVHNALNDLNAELNQECTFKEFWDVYVADNKISMSQSKIFDLAGLSKSTGNDVLNGKNTPKRDTCLALCFAVGMNVENTERALKYAGHSPFYVQKKRDIALQIFFDQHAKGTGDIHNVTELNIALVEEGLDPLIVSK